MASSKQYLELLLVNLIKSAFIYDKSDLLIAVLESKRNVACTRVDSKEFLIGLFKGYVKTFFKEIFNEIQI